jgi:hypothetical protein
MELVIIAGENPGEGVVTQAAVTARTLAGELARGHTHFIGTTVLDVHYPGVEPGREGSGSQGIGPVVKALWAICAGLGLPGIEGQGSPIF